MFDPTGLSRVELEPVLARSLELGLTDDAEAIVNELAGRVWQNHNPYADLEPPSQAATANLTAEQGLSGPDYRE